MTFLKKRRFKSIISCSVCRFVFPKVEQYIIVSCELSNALPRFRRIRIEKPLVCDEEEVTTDAIDPPGIRRIKVGRLTITSLLIYLKRVLPASPERQNHWLYQQCHRDSWVIWLKTEPLWYSWSAGLPFVYNCWSNSFDMRTCSNVSGWCIKMKMGSFICWAHLYRILLVLFPPPHITDALVHGSLSLSLTPSLKAH